MNVFENSLTRPRTVRGLSNSSLPRQQGAALLLTLIMMVAISVLGVASMRASLFETAVSVNAQASSLAFQSAQGTVESYLRTMRRDAEQLRTNSGGTGPILGFAPNMVSVIDGGLPIRFCLDSNSGAPQVTAWQSYDDTGLGTFELGANCSKVGGSPSHGSVVIALPAEQMPTPLGEGKDIRTGAKREYVDIRAYGRVGNMRIQRSIIQRMYTLRAGGGSL